MTVVKRKEKVVKLSGRDLKDNLILILQISIWKLAVKVTGTSHHV